MSLGLSSVDEGGVCTVCGPKGTAGGWLQRWYSLRCPIRSSALSESGIFRPLRDPAGGHLQFRATNHLQFGQRSAGARSAGVNLAVVYSSHSLFAYVRWVFLALRHTRVVYASLDLLGLRANLQMMPSLFLVVGFRPFLGVV